MYWTLWPYRKYVIFHCHVRFQGCDWQVTCGAVFGWFNSTTQRLCHKMSEVLVSNAFLGQSEMLHGRLFVCEFVCMSGFNSWFGHVFLDQNKYQKIYLEPLAPTQCGCKWGWFISRTCELKSAVQKAWEIWLRLPCLPCGFPRCLHHRWIWRWCPKCRGTVNSFFGSISWYWSVRTNIEKPYNSLCATKRDGCWDQLSNEKNQVV